MAKKTLKEKKEKFNELREKANEKMRRRNIEQSDFMTEWQRNYKEQLKEIEMHKKEREDKMKEQAIMDFKKQQQQKNNFMGHETKSVASAVSPSVHGGGQQFDFVEVEEQLQKFESKIKKSKDRNNMHL